MDEETERVACRVKKPDQKHIHAVSQIIHTSILRWKWTIAQSPEYGNLLMMVTLSGFQIIPVRVEPNGAILVGQHRLDPEGTIICQ